MQQIFSKRETNTLSILACFILEFKFKQPGIKSPDEINHFQNLKDYLSQNYSELDSYVSIIKLLDNLEPIYKTALEEATSEYGSTDLINSLDKFLDHIQSQLPKTGLDDIKIMTNKFFDEVELLNKRIHERLELLEAIGSHTKIAKQKINITNNQ